MSRVRLVLHGQGNNLKRDGGIGKYSSELYKRVLSSDIQAYLPGVEVTGWDFPSSEPKSSYGRGLSNLARGWIPPKVVNFVKRSYSSGRDNEHNLASIEGSSGRVIFHEMSNYTSCLEIARLSRSPSVRLCVTFHDVQDLYYPDYFSNEDLRSRKFNYLFYKDAAHQFFSNSEFTKRTMVERLGIPADKIRVTYLAGNGVQIQNDPSQETFARKFGRYLIYPAKFWKHKNHEFLLRAFSTRRDEFKRQGIQLLFTGGFNKEETIALRKLVREADVEDGVQILGFLSAPELSALIRNAYFLVFPSLFEGFGMPVLEALEAGCPVLCSRQGSLPEVAGDAAVYFDPEELDSLVSVFDRVLSDSLDRNELVQEGKEQSHKFNWDQTFMDTAEQYRKLV